jgi:hypothetical protein
MNLEGIHERFCAYIHKLEDSKFMILMGGFSLNAFVREIERAII